MRSRLIQATASSSHGLSLPRRFGLGLSKPQLNLRRDRIINGLKRRPRLAEAVNDCCAYVFFFFICAGSFVESEKWRGE